MRYLVISDIHGNLEALDAVLQDAGEFDACLCLGDVIGYGPSPNECVKRVQELPGLIGLVGNHDMAALGRIDAAMFNGVARTAVAWTANQLTETSRESLLLLEPLQRYERFVLAHGSPRDPVWEYLEMQSQANANFDLFAARVCFVGHTHVPRVFTEGGAPRPDRDKLPAQEGHTIDLADGKRRIVNPGGVGQPRDGDWRAAYALYDDATGIFTFARTPYAIRETQRKIQEAGLPASLASRLALGL